MKRTATATVLGIILVGAIASIAAINVGSSSVVPDLKGKSVILNDEVGLPPVENVRLGVIGEREFIVIPVKQDDGSSYERWAPLDSVSSLSVYDSMEEATKVANQRKAALELHRYGQPSDK